jgi:hypothetical protein
MTGNPSEPPFRKAGPYYFILKIAVLAAAALIALKLLRFI